MRTRALPSLAVAVALGAAGCNGGNIGNEQPDSGPGGGHDAPSSDAGGTCSVALFLPTTSPQVGSDEKFRVTASVLDVPGTITYLWQATLDGVPTEADPAAPDDSAIDIPVTTAGTIHVSVTLADQPACNSAQGDVTVLPTTLATATYRLRVVPPVASDLPATDEIVTVHSGVDTIVPVSLSAGLTVTGARVADSGGTGVPAYVRLTPAGAPASGLDVHSGSDGALPALHVLGQTHTALVVPDSSALAPRAVAWTPGAGSPLVVDGGTTVTGTVRDGAGAAVPGATVTLVVGGVPSSVGTTGAGGAFALHAEPAAGAQIVITVTPPAASGLPRLVASSTAIALAAPWSIAYAPALATRDVSATRVTRGGAPVGGAQVELVGAIAAAGTISDGTTTLTAAGDTRITLTTDAATGALSGRAPAAPLSLIVTRAMDDVALAAIDLTVAAPAQIATSAPAVVTGSTAQAGGAALPGAHLEATGVGALAGIVAATTADASGQFSLPLAAGGSYTLHASDPANRAAPLDQAIASAHSADFGTLSLPTAVHVAGQLTVAGGSTSLAGAAVQLLCGACTGTAALVPISETAADANGRYRLAAPDPAGP